MNPKRLGVLGALGRIGNLVVKATEKSENFTVSASYDIQGEASSEALEKVFAHSDVVIDFSLGSAAKEHCHWANLFKVPLLLGTTGYDLETIKRSCSEASCPILLAPNVLFSVACFIQTCLQLAQQLGLDWDVHVSDHHHRSKKDAPSGTAFLIGKTLQDHCAWLKDRINYSSIRAGQGAVINTVTFCGPGEMITVSHQALNLEAFAQNALQGALWLLQQKPGVYDIFDWVKERRF